MEWVSAIRTIGDYAASGVGLLLVRAMGKALVAARNVVFEFHDHAEIIDEHSDAIEPLVSKKFRRVSRGRRSTDYQPH